LLELSNSASSMDIDGNGSHFVFLRNDVSSSSVNDMKSRTYRVNESSIFLKEIKKKETVDSGYGDHDMGNF
jgi:hypothetical protein